VATCGMEMHDSWLLEVACDADGKGFALFDGVVYRSEGQVFKDAQQSGLQRVRFDFEGMKIEGEIGELKTWAMDGELWVDGKNENGILFLPALHTGQICLEMELADDFRTLKIHASKVTSSFENKFDHTANWDEIGSVTDA
jgi:hypothetical protein